MILSNVPVYALVPARGASKGIPRKNLALLDGKPLIEYTIDAAKNSCWTDEVFVSSDDQSILTIAKHLGVTPLLRPGEYASDEASAVSVVNHFIKFLLSRSTQLDAFILYLQPTSPLRRSEHIDAAIEKMLNDSAQSVVSVVEAEMPPQKSFKLDSNGRLLSMFDERLSNARRQDLPKCFYPNGAIYGFRISEFISRSGFPSNGSIPFVMTRESSVDIDSFHDLRYAESIIRGENG